MQRYAKLRPMPCPFCGEAPELQPEHPECEGNAWGMVACANETCPAKPRVADGEKCNDERGTGAYQDAAIRRWNRRA